MHEESAGSLGGLCATRSEEFLPCCYLTEAEDQPRVPRCPVVTSLGLAARSSSSRSPTEKA
jgi:hypothetical protein